MASRRIAGARFKLSNDPAFVEKLHDVVGLYVAPPAHAVVLSSTRSRQIQALDRTQPGLPLKKGRGATMTHDYKRHGTTTLFAALNVLTARSSGGTCSATGIRSSSASSTPSSATSRPARSSTSILDNYAAHKHAKVRALARAPSALDLPLHADIEFLAERRRGLLRQAHPPTPEARRLSLRRRPAGRDQPLHRRAQRRAPSPSSGAPIRTPSSPPKPRVPNVGVNPLVFPGDAHPPWRQASSSDAEAVGSTPVLCRAASRPLNRAGFAGGSNS